MTEQPLQAITGFAVVTADLTRLVQFYRDVLGFAPHGADQPINESEMALLGLSGAGRRQLLSLGDQSLWIEQFERPGRPHPEDSNAASLWFQHLALVVDDIAAAYGCLRDVTPLSNGGPQLLPSSSGGVQAFKFRDPDGHPLELLRFPDAKTPAIWRDRRGLAGQIGLGIDHSAISVSDAAASAAFYEELGLEIGKRTLNQGPARQHLDGLPDVEVAVVSMNPDSGSPHLELLGYRTPRGKAGLALRPNDVAATRIVWRGQRAKLIGDPDRFSHEGAPPVTQDGSLLPGRLLRRPGPPEPVQPFQGVQIDDPRLAEVLSPDAPLLRLYEGTLHGEGPVWVPGEDYLYWSDVPNRRLLQWHPDDGRVTVAIDGTYFMNGNALGLDGRLVHCEHGRRCISRSNGDGTVEPIVTHFEGKRLNSPNDIAVAADGAIWFTDPTFGLLMPNQGSLAEPDLDHRSVYRFDPATKALRRMADFEQPNGLAFSPDGRTLYVSDTALSLDEIPGPQTGSTHDIQAFDIGTNGTLSGRRLFCHTDHGYPDGLAVDARGWVWTTAADGIHVLAPDRTPLGYIPAPAVCSNCTFGAPGMTRLFIAATNYLLAIDLSG